MQGSYRAEELLRAALKLTASSDDSEVEDGEAERGGGHRMEAGEGGDGEACGGAPTGLFATAPTRSRLPDDREHAAPENSQSFSLTNLTDGPDNGVEMDCHAAYQNINGLSALQMMPNEEDWIRSDSGNSIALESLESLQDEVESLMSSRYAGIGEGNETTDTHGITAVHVRRISEGISKGDGDGGHHLSRGGQPSTRRRFDISCALPGREAKNESAHCRGLSLIDDSSSEERLLASLVKTWTPSATLSPVCIHARNMYVSCMNFSVMTHCHDSLNDTED